MVIIHKHISSYILAFLLIALCDFNIQGQNFPNKQEISLRAPLSIKVDGKALEWDQFQAYNHATQVFYTLSNNDENLYLVIQATDPMVIRKIMMGGITLTIQQSTQKNDPNKKSITYPIVENSPYFKLTKRKNEIEDTTARAADSIMQHYNYLLGADCKWIRVTGIPQVDTLLSVYNIDGINAAGKFNIKKAYTVEMAVALKYLGLPANSSSKFNYHIMLNGRKAVSFGGSEAELKALNPGASEETISMLTKFTEGANQLAAQTAALTDFWGEYTLAKK